MRVMRRSGPRAALFSQVAHNTHYVTDVLPRHFFKRWEVTHTQQDRFLKVPGLVGGPAPIMSAQPVSIQKRAETPSGVNPHESFNGRTPPALTGHTITQLRPVCVRTTFTNRAHYHRSRISAAVWIILFFLTFKNIRTIFTSMEQAKENSQNKLPEIELASQELKNFVIECFSDGYTVEETTEKVKRIFPTQEIFVPALFNDAETLKAIIERTNDKLGQTWGTMWKNIKKKAALGDHRSAKLLIEFVRDQSGGIPKELKLIFEE